MRFYKDVRMRILAGVLVFVMILSTITISQGTSAADYTKSRSSTSYTVNSGESVGDLYTNRTSAMEQLTSATFSVYQQAGQIFSYSVRVYQNLTETSNPESGVSVYSGSSNTVSAVSTAGQQDFTVDLSGAGIYLSAGETAAIIVTFTSISSPTELVLYSDSTSTAGYKMSSGSWSSSLPGIFDFVTSTVSGNVGGITAFSLADSSGSALTSTVLVAGESITVTPTIVPAYARTVSYTSANGYVSISGNTITAGSTTGIDTVTAHVESTDTSLDRTITIYVMDASLSGTSFVYTGSAITPTVTVTCGSTLTQDTDYTVTYANNTNVTDAATVTITGIGSYVGFSKELTFAITAASIEETWVTSGTYAVSTASDTVTSAVLGGNGSSLVYGTNFTATATRTATDGTAKTVTYTITVTGSGNYTGTYTTSVTVSADSSNTIDLTTICTVGLEEDTFSYDGTVKTPSIVFYDTDGNEVALSTDAYTVAYSTTSPIEVGTYTVTVSGNSSAYYSGTFDALEFYIDENNIKTNSSSFSYTVDGTAYVAITSPELVHTGSALEPTVAVTLSTGSNTTYSLVQGTDYTVTYASNTDIGYMTISVRGRGNFTGTQNLTVPIIGDFETDSVVTINRKTTTRNSSTGRYTSTYSATYTGDAIEPSNIVVKIDGDTLTSGTDYQVSYYDTDGSELSHTDAGTATLRIVGLGSYDGKSFYVDYTINPINLSATTFTINAADRTYSGSAQTLATGEYYIMRTKSGGTVTLVEDTDYYLTYSNNTNAGTATVTATGKGNYTGTASETFTISQLNITNGANDNVTNTLVEDVTYDGTYHTPAVSILYGTTVLDASTAGYSISYADNRSVGTATITITGNNNLTGTRTINFAIKNRDFSSISFTVNGVSATRQSDDDTIWTINYTDDNRPVYNGKAQTPSSIVVTDDGTILTANTDYYVAYDSGDSLVNAGTARIYIYGINTYAGATAILEFEIAKKSLTSSDISISYDGSNYTDGSYKLPNLTIVDTGIVPNATLTRSSTGDYVIEGTTSATYAGEEAYCTIVAVADSNYTGEITYGPYTIGTDIATEADNITLINPYTNEELQTVDDEYIIVYMGENRPAISIASESSLTTNDYTATYVGDGTDTTDIYSADTTVTVTLTGTNDYYGTLTKTYTIRKASLSDSTSFVAYSTDSSNTAMTNNTITYTYTGDTIGVQVGIYQQYNSTTVNTLVDDTDFVTSIDTIPAEANTTGTTVTLTGQGNYQGSMTVTYIVGQVELSSTRITLTNNISDQIYTGKAITPTDVVLVDNSLTYTLVKDVDYTLSYLNNTAVGTATVVIAGTGNYTGTVYASFSIVQRNLSAVTISSIPDQIFTGSAVEPSVTVYYGDVPLTENTDYTLTYSNNTDPGTATVTVVAIEDGAYTGTSSATFNILGDLSNETLFTISGWQDSYSIRNGSLNVSSYPITITYTTSSGTTATLTENTDFTVNALNATAPTTSAQIQVQGMGNFTGNRYKTVTIKGYISDTTISGISDSYDFTGSQINGISPTITYGDYDELTEGVDYEVSYGTNVSAGVNAGTVTISALSTSELYSGNKTVTFDIVYNLSTATISGVESNYAYTGSAIQPGTTTGSVSVQCATETLGPSLYTLSYGTNTNVGAGTVTVSSNATWVTGQRTISFTIGGIDLSDTSLVSVSFPSGFESETHKYNGTAYAPEMVVTYGGTTLTRNTDYTVTYTDNVDAGTATVTVTGITNFSGTVEKTFTIAQAQMASDVTATIVDAYYAGGEAITPEYTLTYAGMTLVEGTDFTVTSLGNNRAVTTSSSKATITFKAVDGGNYAGTLADQKFEILQTDLTSGRITVVEYTKEYTGSTITPEITVTCPVGSTSDTYTLVEGTDYTITYSGGTSIVDVGTYVITVTGTGGFTGVLTTNFAVTQKPITSSDITFSDISDQTYTGSAVTPNSEIVVTDTTRNVTLTEGTDYTVSYTNNIASAASDDDAAPTATITGAGNYSGTYNITFNIGEKLSSDNAYIITSPDEVHYTYDGSEHPLSGYTVKLKTGTKATLVEDTDYTVTQPTDSISAGTKTFTVKGTGNYYGTLTKTYYVDAKQVKQADLTVVLSDPDTGVEYSKNSDDIYEVTYYGSAIAPTVTVYDNGTQLATTDYRVTYNNNNEISTSDSMAYVIVTPQNNYADGGETISVPFYINARSIEETGSFELQMDASYAYTGRAITPVKVLCNDGTTEAYALTEGTDYTIAYEDNVNAGTATVTVTGTGNYQGTLSGSFNIYASLANATVTIPTQFYTGEAVQPVPTVVCGGNTLTYGTDFTVVWNSDDNYTTSGHVIINTANGDHYVGSTEADYVISTDTSELVASGYSTTYVYTGSEIIPDFVIATPSGTEVTYSADEITYDHTYADGSIVRGDVTNIGTIDATIPVTIGTVTDTLTVEYEIVAKPIASTNIIQVQNNTYTGKRLTPPVFITYNDTELEENEDYTVTYSNNVDPGVATAVVTGIGNFTGSKTIHFKIVPAKVVGLSATSESTTSATLSWIKGAKVTGYEVYSANGLLKYGYTSGNSFTIRGLSSGTTYTFKVRSYVDVWGNTTYGDFSSVTVTTGIDSVSGVSVTSSTSKRATISWSTSSSSIDGYEIYRSTSSDGEYQKVAVMPITRSSYTDSRLTSGKTYYYKMRAYQNQSDGSAVYSAFSDPIAVTVK